MFITSLDTLKLQEISPLFVLVSEPFCNQFVLLELIH